jgi:hypothetical protein
MPIEIVVQLVTTIATVIGVVLAAYAILSFTKISRIKIGGGQGFEAVVEETRQRISEPSPATDTIDKQYLLLKEYHAQGLAQSKISFWFSLIFASLGFLVIVTAIFTIERQTPLASQGRTLITLIAGTIIDAVSALFFVQSNKARQLMVDFFDRLRNDRKLDESLRLAAGISDPILQNRLHSLLALNFAEIKPTDGFLSSVLGIGAQTMNQTTAQVGVSNTSEGGQTTP